MRFLIAAALVAVAAPASAVTITGLVNTGAGFALGTNGVDTSWQLFGGSAFVSGTNGVFPVATNWLADDGISRWITPTANAGDSLSPVADDNYAYTLDFSMTGLITGTASFTGRFAADNLVTSIRLNGNLLPASGGGFTSWTAFGANSGFLPGANRLTFNVTNVGQVSGNPSGLRVEFLTSDAAIVPEPASWAMLIAGLGLVGAVARRRRVSIAA